jgi:hypothetical protein
VSDCQDSRQTNGEAEEMNKLSSFLRRLAEEPPFRLVARPLIKRLPVSIRTKARWDAASRPQYLAGVLGAVDEALQEDKREISVFEFGVAGGNGLVALENVAAAAEAETGIRVAVYGFDAGTGLPELTGDYRDFPDHWQAGDYPMDEAALRNRLRPSTTLIIGNVADTIPRYLPQIKEPVGFVSVDVDIYSSSRDLLFKMFGRSDRNMLRRVMMYFDDVDLPFTHKFAGELLAIDEFNTANARVKIDRWRGIEKQRPFLEAPWLKRMYIAHDLDAISQARANGKRRVIAIDDETGSTG